MTFPEIQWKCGNCPKNAPLSYWYLDQLGPGKDTRGIWNNHDPSM